MSRPLHSIINPEDMAPAASICADPDLAHDLARERRMMTRAERDQEERERREESAWDALDEWTPWASKRGGTVNGRTVDVLDAYVRGGKQVALVEYMNGTRAVVARKDVEVA